LREGVDILSITFFAHADSDYSNQDNIAINTIENSIAFMVDTNAPKSSKRSDHCLPLLFRVSDEGVNSSTDRVSNIAVPDRLQHA
jgi:hypothetical protein